jgi:hypothetical protein
VLDESGIDSLAPQHGTVRCRRRRARNPAVGGVREDRSGVLKTKPLRG